MKKKFVKFTITFFLFISLFSKAQTIESFTELDGLSSNYVECVAVDIYDNIWFGTSNGVSMYDGNSWTTYNQNSHPQMLSNNIKTITATSNGDIWIGTDFGANKLSSGILGSSWIAFTNNDGLANNKVVSIDEAPNGDLWFSHSSFSAGVSVFDGISWISYNSPDLPISGVCATAFDSNGDKWFASPLDGLAHFDGLNFTNYLSSDGLLSNYSTSICVDNSDNIWLGSQEGMTVVNNNLSQFDFHTIMYSLPPPDTLNPVVEIAKDSWGRIWTTIYVGYLAEGGVAYWNGLQWTDFDHSDGLAGPNVKGLAIDSQNNVWVATTTGVSKIVPVPSISSDEEKSIKIFPIPAKSFINICNSNNEIGSLSIYDNLARECLFLQQDFSNTTLDISKLKAGIYYLKIYYSNQILSHKIIIE